MDFSDLDQSSDFTADRNRYAFLNTLGLESRVISSLSRNLDFIVKGRDEVFLAAIAKENDPSDILSQWNSIYDAKSKDLHTDLISFDLSNKAKYGPRSIQKPWKDRRDSCLSYFDNDKSTHVPSILFKGSGGLRPLSNDVAIKYLKNNTNSGLPDYTKKGKVKDKLLRRFEEYLDKEYPCCLFTRTQELGKTRDIWGYGMADTLNEMRYYVPLLAYQRKLSWRSALNGPHSVDLKISDMFNKHSQSDVFVSADFVGFDKSVNSNNQRMSFDYIKSKYQSSYHKDLDWIQNRFNTIGLITPDGIKSGPHGIPSGATLTNEVDSIVQYSYGKSLGVADDKLQIQGDDGAYDISYPMLEKLIELFKYCGLTLSEDKSVVSQHQIQYLQRIYIKDYMKNGFIGGVYSVYRALNRIVHQERYSDFEDYGIRGVDYYSIRTISILENCKYHPLFKDLVLFIYSKDKYLLKYSQDSISKFSDMLNNGSGTGGFLNNQFGDNIKGINSFETVKIINKIRQGVS